MKGKNISAKHMIEVAFNFFIFNRLNLIALPLIFSLVLHHGNKTDAIHAEWKR